MMIEPHNHLRYDDFVIWNAMTGLYVKHHCEVLYSDEDEYSISWVEKVGGGSRIPDDAVGEIQDALRRRLAGVEYTNDNHERDRCFADHVIDMFDDGVITSIFDLKLVPVYYRSMFSRRLESRIGCAFSLAEPILEVL